MKVYVAHLKSGACPKHSRQVRAKGGIKRCRIAGRGNMKGKGY